VREEELNLPSRKKITPFLASKSPKIAWAKGQAGGILEDRDLENHLLISMWR
jgi:hypothetical protein